METILALDFKYNGLGMNVSWNLLNSPGTYFQHTTADCEETAQICCLPADTSKEPYLRNLGTGKLANLETSGKIR